ncbi:hypothetical protein DFH09DRAFT_1091572 [Mycena vulgaris]|nr:hypothetical protein DFH09DRAFT_1091572 [Mycena vulgaris]
MTAEANNVSERQPLSPSHIALSPTHTHDHTQNLSLIAMSPLNIALRDASASSSVSDIPAPTTSMSPYYDDRPPIVIPDWVGWFGLGFFACIIIFQFYWTLTRSPKIALEAEQWEVDKLLAEDAEMRMEKMAAPAIPRPPHAYTTTVDNAAPESDASLSHFTALNTLKNQRRRVAGVSDDALVEKQPLPPMFRPPGARW